MAAGAPVGPVCCGDCPGPAWLSAFCGGITAAAPTLCPGLRRPPGQGSVPGAGRLRGALFPHRMELPADPPARIPPGGHSAGAPFCAEYHVLRVLHRRAGQPVEAAAGRRTQLRCILAPANRQLLSDDLLCVRVAESGGHRGGKPISGSGHGPLLWSSLPPGFRHWCCASRGICSGILPGRSCSSREKLCGKPPIRCF